MRNQRRSADVFRGDQSLAIRLMEHLVIPTFVLDADRRVLIWNKACERLTGIAAAEVIGTSDHWRGFYRHVRPCLADLVATGRFSEIDEFYGGNVGFGLTDAGVTLEVTITLPTRERETVLLVDAGPIYDETGALLAVIQTFRDITAEKDAQKELQTLAARDGLTNLNNRRSFDATLISELRRSDRSHDRLALLLIDIDHFKLFNDNFGHIAGDTCLKRIAGAISSGLRTGDTAARYGGEEFAIILPQTDRDGAEKVAERLRLSVEALGVDHPTAPRGIVTLSIGATAGVGGTDLAPSDLVAAADDALYRSKRNGRNMTSFVETHSSSVVLF